MVPSSSSSSIELVAVNAPQQQQQLLVDPEAKTTSTSTSATITKLNGRHINQDDKFSLDNEKKDDDDDEEEATFWKLIQRYRPFRLYVLSFLISETGEWLTYIAAITVIESSIQSQHNDGDAEGDGGSADAMPRTAVGVLVVIRLIPSVLLMSAGGALADSRDRRVSMMYLDVVAAAVVALFTVAFSLKSIAGIYIVTFCQECLAALYEPCRSSIIPLLVPQENYLQKATTLSELASFLMTAVGSLIGGFALTYIGLNGCVILDSMTYLASAYILWWMGGKYNVALETNDEELLEDTLSSSSSSDSVVSQMINMTIDGTKYLYTSSFGALVLVKASSGLIYGATYLLHVSFSEHVQDGHSGERLGMLFALGGIGCIVGTLIGDHFTDMSQPSTLQIACVASLAIQTLGVLGMATFRPFWCICLMTLVESSGSSVLWINSSLLLQKFCAPAMLGRVVAVEYLLFGLTEAVSAMLCGILQDKFHLSARRTSLVFACVGSVLVVAWVCYHIQYQQQLEQQQQQQQQPSGMMGQDYAKVETQDDDDDSTKVSSEQEEEEVEEEKVVRTILLTRKETF